MKNIDLMTSHSFTPLDIPNSVYYGDFRSIGQDLIRAQKPELKAWVTSRPWSTDQQFIENIRRDIYECKVNGLIPWALISGANQWLESNGEYSDGSMKSAFLIHEDGTFDVLKGYYYYKQITRAGQPGMKVAQVTYLDPSVTAIAFASNNTNNPDAFLIINKSDKTKHVSITVHGIENDSFTAFRTSSHEDYLNIGEYEMSNKSFSYISPAGSVTTFFRK